MELQLREIISSEYGLGCRIELTKGDERRLPWTLTLRSPTGGASIEEAVLRAFLAEVDASRARDHKEGTL